HLRAPQETVLAFVGEGHARVARFDGPHLPEHLQLVAADIEHIAEVSIDPKRAFDVHRLAAAILDPDPLMQAAVDEAAAPDAEALLGDPPLALVEDEHGVDHLK